MTMIPTFDVLDAPSAAAVRTSVSRPVHHPQMAGQRSAAHPHQLTNAGLYRRRRLCAAVVVFLLTVVSVIGVGQAGAERDPNSEPVVAATTLVIVQPGDTLWDIAGRVAPDVDRRKAVDQLAEIAGGAQLEVGQRLEVPAISD